MNTQMRKSALRRYLVFRVKAVEFLDIAALRQTLVSINAPLSGIPVTRSTTDFAGSLRTYQLSCFALFIDKSKDGMNVIELWKQLFPELASQIAATWAEIEKPWQLLRQFRDKAGFHADAPIAFFRARNDVVANHAELTEAMEKFHVLFTTILKAEQTMLPDLQDVLEELLLELEQKRSGRRYDREKFRAYLMIPPRPIQS